MKRIIIAALVGVLVSGPINAQSDFTGNVLHESCKAPEDSDVYLLCGAYISGVAHILLNRKFYSQKILSKICIPPSVTNGQIIDITKKFLREQPEMRDAVAGGIVIIAVAEAFPCKK